MNRMLKIAAAVTGVGAGLPVVGCVHTDAHPHQGPVEAHYDNLVDRCWPTRYSYHARQNVLAPFAVQVTNAAILDQTIWMWMFEPGTATLNPAGLEKLDYLVRRRPHPDGRIFLQTSVDLIYDAKDPAKFVSDREKLDKQRGQAVLDYLAARTAGRPMHFEVQVIDATDPALSSNLASAATRGLTRQYQSGILGVGAGGGGFAGGGSGGGAGGGGFGGSGAITGAGGAGGLSAPVTGASSAPPAN